MTNPNWQAVADDVALKIKLLKAAWEHTEKEAPPAVHAKMVESLYGPALSLLADFCLCIDVGEEDGEPSENGGQHEIH